MVFFTLTDDAIDSDVLSDGAASYMQGAGGLIGETRGGTSKYYHADALGTTRAITNSSQTKTDSLDTDAFGMSVSATGTTPTPFGFAGQHGYQNDSVTGLMRLGHRFYDASAGRFLSRDPIQDGYNWYAYVNNDPVNKIDPKGLGWWPWPWGGDIYNSTDKPILVIGEPGRGKKQKKIWIAPGKSDPPNFDADHYLDPNDGKWHDIKGNGFRGGSVTVEEGFTRHGGPINDYDKQREHPYKKRYFSGPYPNYVGGEGANGTP